MTNASARINQNPYHRPSGSRPRKTQEPMVSVTIRPITAAAAITLHRRSMKSARLLPDGGGDGTSIRTMRQSPHPRTSSCPGASANGPARTNVTTACPSAQTVRARETREYKAFMVGILRKCTCRHGEAGPTIGPEMGRDGLHHRLPRTPARLADGLGAELPRPAMGRISPYSWFPRSPDLSAGGFGGCSRHSKVPSNCSVILPSPLPVRKPLQLLITPIIPLYPGPAPECSRLRRRMYSRTARGIR
jgi:hypothetical protein